MNTNLRIFLIFVRIIVNVKCIHTRMSSRIYNYAPFVFVSHDHSKYNENIVMEDP